MNKSIIVIPFTLFFACSKQQFKAGNNKTTATKNSMKNDPNENPVNPSANDVIDGGEITLEKCSAGYQIPGTANIYFAGSPTTASLTYNFRRGNNTDLATTTAPIEIKPTSPSCLAPGSKLSFDTTGALSHGGGTAGANSPEGNGSFSGHALGAQLGKSDIVAPMVSMVAVFIGANDPSASAAPAKLDFTNPNERNYKTLQPALGQVFFVGDGKTDSGEIQSVTVPEGATRLFMGVWDVGQWNNNSGTLNGAISQFK